MNNQKIPEQEGTSYNMYVRTDRSPGHKSMLSKQTSTPMEHADDGI